MSSLMELTTPGHYLAFFHDDGRFIRGGDETKYQIRSPHDPDYFSEAAKPWRFWVYTTLSKDGGFTWSLPAPIAMLPDANLCLIAALVTISLPDPTRAHGPDSPHTPPFHRKRQPQARQRREVGAPQYER